MNIEQQRTQSERAILDISIDDSDADTDDDGFETSISFFDFFSSTIQWCGENNKIRH